RRQEGRGSGRRGGQKDWRRAQCHCDRRPWRVSDLLRANGHTQLGSVEIAVDKARSAALFRRPSKVFEDALAGGRTAMLAWRGATRARTDQRLSVQDAAVGDGERVGTVISAKSVRA